MGNVVSASIVTNMNPFTDNSGLSRNVICGRASEKQRSEGAAYKTECAHYWETLL